MKTIDCSTLFLPYLCKVLNYSPSAMAQCITLCEDGAPIAGVVYDGYNTVSIGAHIWIDDEHRPSKEWYAAIFDYPFNRLKVEKLFGQVAGNNEDAQRLDKHFGFVEEARLENYSLDGALIVYSMTKDQCRVLTSPLWTKTLKLVEAA